MLFPKDIQQFCQSLINLFTITDGNGEHYPTIEETPKYQLAFWSSFITSLGQELKSKGFVVEGLLSSSIIPNLSETLEAIRAAKQHCALNLFNQLDTYNKALQLFKMFCKKHRIKYQTKELQPNYHSATNNEHAPISERTKKLLTEALTPDIEKIKQLVEETFVKINLEKIDTATKLKTFLKRFLFELKLSLFSLNPELAEQLSTPNIQALEKSPEDYLGAVEARKYIELLKNQLKQHQVPKLFIENTNKLSKWVTANLD